MDLVFETIESFKFMSEENVKPRRHNKIFFEKQASTLKLKKREYLKSSLALEVLRLSSHLLSLKQEIESHFEISCQFLCIKFNSAAIKIGVHSCVIGIDTD